LTGQAWERGEEFGKGKREAAPGWPTPDVPHVFRHAAALHFLASTPPHVSMRGHRAARAGRASGSLASDRGRAVKKPADPLEAMAREGKLNRPVDDLISGGGSVMVCCC
jgi:hypothetical protein